MQQSQVHLDAAVLVRQQCMDGVQDRAELALTVMLKLLSVYFPRLLPTCPG
jgi:hypothetical protein